MATYNGARFIKQQIQSILDQLGPDDELVISDDSSTDATVEIVKGFQDSRIVLREEAGLRSAPLNFERALKAARGQIIFLADQDDEWITGWVECALRNLDSVGLVVCDYILINEDGNPIPRPNVATRRRTGLLRNLIWNGYMGCCSAFRRELLEAALPFPQDLQWHDWWLGLIAEAYDMHPLFLKERFIRYRRHGNNASPTGERSTAPLIPRIVTRWHLGEALLQRWLAKSPASRSKTNHGA